MKLTINTELKTITVTGEFKPDELQKLVKSAGLEEYSVFAGEQTGSEISWRTSSGSALTIPYRYNADPIYVNSRLTNGYNPAQDYCGTISYKAATGIPLTNSIS